MSKKKIVLILLTFIFIFNMKPIDASNKIIQTMDNTNVVSSMDSYIGIVNEQYFNDNGTRFYILPRNKVTTGLGGAIKIFADPYHLQDSTNYDFRDLGIYFYQDQMGDEGTNGTGVFWINSKSYGPSYNGKSPDIGFSFQDGASVAARMSYQNGSSLLTVGEGLPQIHKTSPTTKLEMHGDIAFRNNDMLRWVSTSGYADSGIRLEKDNSLNLYIRSNSIFKAKNNANNTNQVKFDSSVAMGTAGISNPTNLNVQGSNVFTINNSQETTINSIINGTKGQEITLIFENGQTTIENNDLIRLKESKNFVVTENDTIKLVFNGKSWYEVSRSLN